MTPPAELQEAEAQTSSPSVSTLTLKAQATIGEKGRLVIPAAIREELKLEPGEVLDMYVENHELHISTRQGRLMRAKQRLRRFAKPGILASDELSADRRKAAEDE
jgi:AbrB family looped-hinge helix DNA binding protein